MSGAPEKLPLTFAIPAEAPFPTGATVVTNGTGRKWKLEKVPEWWYKEKVCGNLDKAAFFWISNAVCMIFHLGLALTTVFVSTADGRSFATPTLTVYVTNLTWVPNSTDALRPVFQKADTPLYLSTMTMWFFLLSALAHGLIVVGNFRQAFAYGVFITIDNEERIEARKRVSSLTGWYYVWLHQCRQPLRYAYSSTTQHTHLLTPVLYAQVD